MGRNGKFSKSADRQARRDAKEKNARSLEDVAGEQGRYVPPDRSATDEKHFYLPVDGSATIKIAVRQWKQGGRLVDFFLAVVLTSWDATEEPHVYEIDCRHGHCHGHVVIEGRHSGEPDSLHRLDVVGDVKDALSVAVHKATAVASMIRDMEPEE
ncbi:hypothetical protein [Microbacterium halotolerans]|uniref:hypothetical protein n=1 Tax=Microbacterium halotolerans TaxID=246613 RepID=UPI0013C32833|nr:hypothetical protein [Microbacterium halotolerans]